MQYFFSAAILIYCRREVAYLMRSQSGNFLLQALLALALVFAFIPFFAARLAARDSDAQMYSTTRQVATATTAARIFIRENASNIQYDTTVVSGDDFSDLLEPYGLPLGFVPRTALGQDVALVITKTPYEIAARLELSGGDLTQVQLAELARRIGFYADYVDGVVRVGIVLDDAFSDIVRRNETDSENNAFLTDLNMGGFVLDGGGRFFARRGEFDTGTVGTLSLLGLENGRKVRNAIDNIAATRAVFKSADGASALALTRGELTADSLSVRTIAAFGDTGNFISDVASVYDFAMTAGRTGFTGAGTWNVHGNVIADRINFSVERLDVSAYINVARGQDVYIDPDELVYSSRSGIETDVIAASNITMRDQTSDSLSNGGSGATILDIRPAGTSLLPDAYVGTINNSSFEIIAKPGADDGTTVDCKSIINSLDGVYNQASLSQYLICQYVYWLRLEQRIDIKQCLMAGGDNCD